MGQHPDHAAMKPPHARRCFVALTDFEVMADIGVHDAEIGRLQPLRIAVTLETLHPGVDSIEEAFDYGRIVEEARHLASSRTCLIETFASRLGEACLESALVLSADVHVEKPWAIPGCLAAARVISTKTKDEIRGNGDLAAGKAALRVEAEYPVKIMA